MYQIEFIEGEGWQVFKGEECYDWGLTKEEAEIEALKLNNKHMSRRVVNGVYID